MHILMINFEMLSIISERRKTFDSLLANHFSAVMLRSHFGVKRLPGIMYISWIMNIKLRFPDRSCPVSDTGQDPRKSVFKTL